MAGASGSVLSCQDLLGGGGHGCRHGRGHGRMGHRHVDPCHQAPLALDLLQDERPHGGRIQVYDKRWWSLCGHARQYSTRLCSPRSAGTAALPPVQPPVIPAPQARIQATVWWIAAVAGVTLGGAAAWPLWDHSPCSRRSRRSSASAAKRAVRSAAARASAIKRAARSAACCALSSAGVSRYAPATGS